MSLDTKARLIEAVKKTKDDIDTQLNRYIDELTNATDDPYNFVTMSQLEAKWVELSQSVNKRYIELFADSLSAFDSEGLVQAKKNSSSKKGSC